MKLLILKIQVFTGIYQYQVLSTNLRIKKDINIDELVLQKEEVESLHWFSEDEIKNLMKRGEFFDNHYEEFEILLDWLKNK